jgi:hypothetical protein
VSAKVTVLDEGRSYRCKRSQAREKVRRGNFDWRDEFTIQRRIASPSAITSRPFFFGPSASFTDWIPRDSAGYLVMQLRTRRSKAS